MVCRLWQCVLFACDRSFGNLLASCRLFLTWQVRISQPNRKSTWSVAYGDVVWLFRETPVLRVCPYSFTRTPHGKYGFYKFDIVGSSYCIVRLASFASLILFDSFTELDRSKYLCFYSNTI